MRGIAVLTLLAAAGVLSIASAQTAPMKPDIANFTPPTASSASPGATSTTPTAAPTAGEDEILKRLMEQRKQQMGQ
jgi:hypothetical protein